MQLTRLAHTHFMQVAVLMSEALLVEPNKSARQRSNRGAYPRILTGHYALVISPVWTHPGHLATRRNKATRIPPQTAGVLPSSEN